MARGNRRHSTSHAGQGVVEYMLLLALMTLAGGVLYYSGINLRRSYCKISSMLGASPQVCLPQIAWQEDFSTLDAWNITHGSGWLLEDGKLRIDKYGEHRAFTGDEGWEDYTIHLGQAVLNNGRGFGVYFRITDEPEINGYAFQYDPGYNNSFIIREIVNGRELSPPIAVAPAPAGFDWYNTPHQIDIEVLGDTFTAYVDGIPAVTAEDDTSPTGRIGLRGWNTGALFDDLTVTQP